MGMDIRWYKYGTITTNGKKKQSWELGVTHLEGTKNTDHHISDYGSQWWCMSVCISFGPGSKQSTWLVHCVARAKIVTVAIAGHFPQNSRASAFQPPCSFGDQSHCLTILDVSGLTKSHRGDSYHLPPLGSQSSPRLTHPELRTCDTGRCRMGQQMTFLAERVAARPQGFLKQRVRVRGNMWDIGKKLTLLPKVDPKYVDFRCWAATYVDFVPEMTVYNVQ